MDDLRIIYSSLKNSKDYIYGNYKVGRVSFTFLYNEVLCDSRSIDEYVLKPLSKLKGKKLYKLDLYLANGNIFVIEQKDIFSYLNKGFFILSGKEIYAIELKSNLNRGIGVVTSELSLSGPKDSFTENFNTNLGLIRKRITSSLKVDTMDIGRYTSTKVGVLSVDGIVKEDLVHHVLKNLSHIDIDGIMDSSYLKESLENHFNIFPTIMMSERPDKCSMALLEGKVVVLVDNSCYGLILPSFFFDYFHTTDDYYQKPVHTSFIRLVRVCAFLIAIFTPSIYIAVTTRNYDFVPYSLLMILKAGRTFVPFPAYLEAFFMILCFEILKESDLRMSTTSGSSISILGGLILGDAAVSAGVVSPIMIIVIAISSIAGLIFASVELGNALRTFKLFFLFLSTIFGLFGVLIGSIFLLYLLFSTEIFGYSYIYYNKYEIMDFFLRISKKNKYRNSKLTNNIYRGRIQ
ncbi:MAG: spore germination protein [Bacilli bacterium]|nr:spore germination protein [Bacilli bacterium]